MSAALAYLFLSCIPPVPWVSLPGPVVRPFVPPACARCAGHRGVTLSVPAGATVRALADGTVVFDGMVARRRFVVVRTPAGDLVSYGDLVGPVHSRDEEVTTGSTVGISTGLVYVGVRRGGLPVDPRATLGSAAARLVPPPALACPVGPARARR